MTGLYRCSNCDDVIDGKIITLDNKFVCGKCTDEVITLQLALQISNKINVQGKERACGICSRPVIGDCMISSGKYYHKHCMTCSVCGDRLNGTYFTFLDKLICEKDYKVRSA